MCHRFLYVYRAAGERSNSSTDGQSLGETVDRGRVRIFDGGQLRFRIRPGSYHVSLECIFGYSMLPLKLLAVRLHLGFVLQSTLHSQCLGIVQH